MTPLYKQKVAALGKGDGLLAPWSEFPNSKGWTGKTKVDEVGIKYRVFRFTTRPDGMLVERIR